MAEKIFLKKIRKVSKCYNRNKEINLNNKSRIIFRDKKLIGKSAFVIVFDNLDLTSLKSTLHMIKKGKELSKAVLKDPAKILDRLVIDEISLRHKRTKYRKKRDEKK